MPRVNIHVVTYNSAHFIAYLLESILRQGLHDYRIVIVDNASSDGTVECIERMRDRFPVGVLTVLKNYKNTGFAHAHNQAIELTRLSMRRDVNNEEYVCITNPDIVFGDNALAQLVVYTQKHSEVGVVSPRLMRYGLSKDDSALELGGAIGGAVQPLPIIDSMGMRVTPWGRVIDRQAGQRQGDIPRESYDVVGVSGACLLIRAGAIDAVCENGAFFDDAFFAYKEDVDISFRLAHKKIRSQIVPDCVAYHARGHGENGARGIFFVLSYIVRAGGDGSFKTYLSLRNHVGVYIKNMPLGTYMRIPGSMCMTMVYACIALLFPAWWGRIPQTLRFWWHCARARHLILGGSFLNASGFAKLWKL